MVSRKSSPQSQFGSSTLLALGELILGLVLGYAADASLEQQG